MASFQSEIPLQLDAKDDITGLLESPH